MRKGQFKLIHYRGYFGSEDSNELYNMDDDLEELHDLYNSEKAIASRMKNELLETLRAGDQEYQSRYVIHRRFKKVRYRVVV